jgi:hypothetical protein
VQTEIPHAAAAPVEEPSVEPSPVEKAPESDLVAYSPPIPEAIESETITRDVPRTRTVREFFATLGARKPPEIPDRNDPGIAEGETERAEEATIAARAEPQPETIDYPLADDAFANLFVGAAVKPEDSRAAAALSAAVAHPPRKTPSPTVPRPAVPAAPTEVAESEEDIRRFREWLDGLSET